MPSSANNSQFEPRPALLAATLLFAAFAIWGSPFLFDYLNSGDQLTPLVQTIEPGLFPNDQDVPVLRAFKSGFYLLLAQALRLARVAPQQTEPIVYALYLISKLLLLAGICYVAWALKRDPWFLVVLVAWCCHQKPALLGSVTLFLPLLTHNEVALILGLFALGSLLRQRWFWFWLLTGLAVLVHVLVGLQFALCFAPLLFWRRQFGKGFWPGLAVFGLCCLVYLTALAPPSLSAEEIPLFRSLIGSTGHISLFSQGWQAWLGFAAIFGLAWAAYDRFLRHEAKFAFLLQAAGCGAMIGSVLSLAAVLSGQLQLMQFQPMRVFYWVTLLCFMVIAAATVEAFKASRLAGLLLASVLVLTTLNSILLLPFALLAVCYFLAQHWRGQSDFLIAGLAGVILLLAVAGIVAAWALGARQPVASLRSPQLLLPGALCLAVLCLPSVKRWYLPLSWSLIIYCLLTASLYRHSYYARWTDPDWRAVRLWCQANTQPTDRFLTPPDQAPFRLLSLRTTISEAMPRLVWLSPSRYLENRQVAERASVGYAATTCAPDYLFALAQEWNCQYVVARGAYDDKFQPLFRAGKYSVLKAPVATERPQP